jgi:hypothetical protein
MAVLGGAAMLAVSMSPASAFTLPGPSLKQVAPAAQTEQVFWRGGGWRGGWGRGGWGWGPGAVIGGLAAGALLGGGYYYGRPYYGYGPAYGPYGYGYGYGGGCWRDAWGRLRCP